MRLSRLALSPICRSRVRAPFPLPPSSHHTHTPGGHRPARRRGGASRGPLGRRAQVADARQRAAPRDEGVHDGARQRNASLSPSPLTILGIPRRTQQPRHTMHREALLPVWLALWKRRCPPRTRRSGCAANTPCCGRATSRAASCPTRCCAPSPPARCTLRTRTRWRRWGSSRASSRARSAWCSTASALRSSVPGARVAAGAVPVAAVAVVGAFLARRRRRLPAAIATAARRPTTFSALRRASARSG